MEKKSEKAKSSLWHIARTAGIVLFILLVTFLFLQNSPLSIWRSGETGTDSSVFKTVALMMRHGGMPYRDTFDHKGPLLYLLNYTGSLISYYKGVWFIELLMDFTAFLLFTKLPVCVVEGFCLCAVCWAVFLFFLNILREEI